jgi:hypothetical protein
VGFGGARSGPRESARIDNSRGVHALLLSRFPSKAQILPALVACALPVFAWAVLTYLYALPGFLVRLNLWDTIGTASYPLAFALIESLVLLAPLVVAAAVLPPRLFKDHFVAISTAIVFVSSGWMMRANYLRIDLAGLDTAQVGAILAQYLVSLVIPIVLIVRFKRIEQIIQTIIERVSVLVYLYLGLGCIAFIIVVLRNL